MDKIHRFDNESNTVYNFRKHFIVNNIFDFSRIYYFFIIFSILHCSITSTNNAIFQRCYNNTIICIKTACW